MYRHDCVSYKIKSAFSLATKLIVEIIASFVEPYEQNQPNQILRYETAVINCNISCSEANISAIIGHGPACPFS